MRKLSTVQEDVDRSIEKALYTVLRANGYIPEKGGSVTTNDYEIEAAAIKADKGFVIQLYGNGAPEDRQNLNVPRIVITGQGFGVGSAGTEFGDSYEQNEDGTYTKYSEGAPLSNYRVRIELWSNKTSQDRLLEAVRASALPNLNFIPKWDDPTNFYLLTYAFTANVPELQHGITHKIYTYEVVDVVEIQPDTKAIAVPKIEDIEVIAGKIPDDDITDGSNNTTIIILP